MRFEGWVVTTNDQEPDTWEIFHGNGALLLATTLEELANVIINEREVNAGEDNLASQWDPSTWRAANTITGQQIRYNATQRQFEDAITGKVFGPEIEL